MSRLIVAARAVGAPLSSLKTWGKRSASGRRRTLVVKAGGRCGHVVKISDLVHMSMPTPPCPHSAARAVLRSASLLGCSASVVVFRGENVQFSPRNTDLTAPRVSLFPVARSCYAVGGAFDGKPPVSWRKQSPAPVMRAPFLFGGVL